MTYGVWARKRLRLSTATVVPHPVMVFNFVEGEYVGEYLDEFVGSYDTWSGVVYAKGSQIRLCTVFYNATTDRYTVSSDVVLHDLGSTITELRGVAAWFDDEKDVGSHVYTWFAKADRWYWNDRSDVVHNDSQLQAWVYEQRPGMNNAYGNWTFYTFTSFTPTGGLSFAADHVSFTANFIYNGTSYAGILVTPVDISLGRGLVVYPETVTLVVAPTGVGGYPADCATVASYPYGPVWGHFGNGKIFQHVANISINLPSSRLVRQSVTETFLPPDGVVAIQDAYGSRAGLYYSGGSGSLRWQTDTTPASYPGLEIWNETELAKQYSGNMFWSLDYTFWTYDAQQYEGSVITGPSRSYFGGTLTLGANSYDLVLGISGSGELWMRPWAVVDNPPPPEAEGVPIELQLLVAHTEPKIATRLRMIPRLHGGEP